MDIMQLVTFHLRAKHKKNLDAVRVSMMDPCGRSKVSLPRLAAWPSVSGCSTASPPSTGWLGSISIGLQRGAAHIEHKVSGYTKTE